MIDRGLLRERLAAILNALERVPRHFSGIGAPSDFIATDDGIDKMDAICMVLIAVGEGFKAIDRQTDGHLLSRYPEVKCLPRSLAGALLLLVKFPLS